MKTLTIEHKTSKKQFFAHERKENNKTVYFIPGAQTTLSADQLKLNWNVLEVVN
jgi:hypothetical protein